MTSRAPDDESFPYGHQAVESDDSTGPLILVVDDSVDMRHLLEDVLAPRGYDVVAVPSGARAIGFMARRIPDLVITDLFMPGMSGFGLRALMLRRTELARVPVIVLSAYWQRPRETLDVAAVLTKPVNLDRLIEAVDRAIDGPAMPASESA